MKKHPNELWEIVFDDEEQERLWTEAYDALDPGYKWQVESFLNDLVLYKKPWDKYEGANCSECVKGMYIFNRVYTEGVNRAIQIVVWFDEENYMLTPLRCELV